MTSEQFTALYAQVQVHTYQLERVMADVSDLRATGASGTAVQKLEADIAAMMASHRQLENDLRAMRDPDPTQPPTPPTGFWPSLLAALSAPLQTWGKLRFTAQLLIAITAIFFGLVMTDGGREIIAAMAGGTANVAQEVAQALRGEQDEPSEDATELPPEPAALESTEFDETPPVASPPPVNE